MCYSTKYNSISERAQYIDQSTSWTTWVSIPGRAGFFKRYYFLDIVYRRKFLKSEVSETGSVSVIS
jgi:hypothetical protein